MAVPAGYREAEIISGGTGVISDSDMLYCNGFPGSDEMLPGTPELSLPEAGFRHCLLRFLPYVQDYVSQIYQIYQICRSSGSAPAVLFFRRSRCLTGSR